MCVLLYNEYDVAKLSGLANRVIINSRRARSNILREKFAEIVLHDEHWQTDVYFIAQ